MNRSQLNQEENTVTLLLRTTGPSSGGEALTGGLECAVVQLKPPMLAKLLARAENLLAAHRQDASLYEMYYWDEGPMFFEDDLPCACEDEAGEQWLRSYEDRGYALLPREVTARLTAGEFEPRRTECDQLALSCAPRPEHPPDVHVRWVVIPKHGGIHVDTAQIPLAELERFMVGQAV